MQPKTNDQQAQGGGETAYSNTDWEAYAKSRPPYPKSLIDIIYKYHRERATPGWNKLVDIGSGNGIAVTNFAQDFKVLHLSDPGASNVEKATALVSEWLASHDLHSIVESSQCTGEDVYKHVGDADMVICATAAHFMDPDGLATSVANILRPGGTMAIFFYWWPTFPKQSQRFNDKYIKASISIMSHLRKNADASLHASMGNVLTRVWSGQGGLEFFPISSEHFENKKRVIINASHGEMLGLKAGSNDLLVEGEKPIPSRILHDDKIVRFETGVDNEAEGWGFHIDKTFLFNFLQTMRPVGSPMSDEEFDAYLAEFSRVFDAECPSGQVYTVWPANIVLGTRK